jgi:hypothetical protein
MKNLQATGEQRQEERRQTKSSSNLRTKIGREKMRKKLYVTMKAQLVNLDKLLEKKGKKDMEMKKGK